MSIWKIAGGIALGLFLYAAAKYVIATFAVLAALLTGVTISLMEGEEQHG